MQILPILFVIPAIVGLGFLIGFHELGHFLFCKLFRIKTPSFSIGFGPKLISKKIGETEFSLSAIPLGGYVEIAGLAEVGQGEQLHANDTDTHSFQKKPWYQKMLVMSGGILFNLIFAYVVFILLSLTGLPSSPMLYPYNATTTLQTVAADSPAAKAGLQADDIVLAIDGIPTASAENALKSIQSKTQAPITISYQRDGVELETTATLEEKTVLGKSFGYLGAQFKSSNTQPLSPIAALSQGARITYFFMKQTFYGLAYALTSRDMKSFGGPVMIIQQTATGASKGLGVFLIFLALISVNLALLNLLPLPILDGGQIVFATIESLIGRAIPLAIKEYIHIASWVGILLLTLYLTYHDLMRIFMPLIEKIISVIS